MKRTINLEFSLFNIQPNKIALERSEEVWVVFRVDVCALKSEMYVFIDESGIVRDKLSHNLFPFNEINPRSVVVLGKESMELSLFGIPPKI